jgi:hypothetical protein
MLPKEAINEFIQIYQKEYGEILDTEEATQKANELVWLFKELKRIPPPPVEQNNVI